MLRTATNEARAAIRNSRYIPTAEIDDRPDVLVPQPDAGPVEDELRAAVALAFAQLSKRCQQLLRLLTTDPPLTYAQIAETLERVARLRRADAWEMCSGTAVAACDGAVPDGRRVAMTDRFDLNDDDRLLALLGDVLNDAEPVPDRLREYARTLIELGDLDRELAQLTYDSADRW